MLKTTIISFSSRADGNCGQIGRFIQSRVADSVLFSFADFEIHACGRCSYECFANREACPNVNDMEITLLEAVVNSDITYFILPNYCDYPCANFFIFNERSQCFFQGKPDVLDAYLKVPKRAIVISNTDEDNFRKALSYQSEAEPDILFLSAKKYGKKSIAGDLLSSEAVVSELTRYINS